MVMLHKKKGNVVDIIDLIVVQLAVQSNYFL